MAKKFFLYFLLIMGIAGGAYYFTPFGNFADNFAGKYGANLLSALEGKKIEVKNYVEEGIENVIPKNPEEKRSDLIEKLKNDLVRIESAITAADTDQDYLNGLASSSMQLSAIPSVKELVGDSKNIISQLEGLNKEKSIIQAITQKIVESILPSKETTVDCDK